VTDAAEQRWPGEHLGLPETGRRSIARLPRRIVALLVDWLIASVLSLAFFPVGPWQTNGFVTLGIFAVLQIVFQLVVNGSIGHLVAGIRVVPLVGGRLRAWQPFVRTALLCLAVPALIWNADQRGLHDQAAATMLVRIA
jgi:uncharacterized RDD family membrane protein YckC